MSYETKQTGIWVCSHCATVIRGEAKALTMRVRLHSKAKHAGLPHSEKFAMVAGSPDRVDSFVAASTYDGSALIVNTPHLHRMRRKPKRQHVVHGIEATGGKTALEASGGWFEAKAS